MILMALSSVEICITQQLQSMIFYP